MSGQLWIVPTPLDFGSDEQLPLTISLPHETIKAAAAIDQWICESAKTARAFLKRVHSHVPLAKPLQDLRIIELPRHLHKHGDHDGLTDSSALLREFDTGRDVGLLSEAGVPAVADPGSSVVRAAHRCGMKVTPLVGPCSIVLALCASGLNGQNFAFTGYLPTDAENRRRRIVELERQARATGQSQIFIETPYRNAAMLQALLSTLDGRTWLAIAMDVTQTHGSCVAATVDDWRRREPPIKLSQAMVFCIGK